MNGKSAKKALGLRSTSTVFNAIMSTESLLHTYDLYVNQIWQQSIHPVWSTGLVVLLPASAAVNGQYLKAQCMDFGVQ